MKSISPATVRRRRRRRTALALGGLGCVLAVLAGCGTRLDTNGQGSAGLGTQNGVGGNGSGSASVSAGGPGGPGAVGANGLPVTGGAAGTAGSGFGAGTTAAGGTSAAAGQTSSRVLGVSATTISIGYPYSTTAPLAAFSAACSACSSFGNETYLPQLYKVIADDLNAKGGILGHKVVFQGYPYNSTGPASDSSQAAQFEQAACNNFTQDAPSFAVIFESLDPEVLAPCLSKHGVSLVAPAVLEDQVDLTKRLLYAPGAGVDYPFMKVFLERLKAQGYFSGWDTNAGKPSPAPAKIGVVNFNDPGWIGQGQQLLKALKDLGIQVSSQDVLWYSAELDTQSQSVQNAVLKFHTDGITHVLGSGANGLWMYEAVGQNYFPRYGWYLGFSNDQNARSQQGLVGAMGIGYFPVADIDPAQKPPSMGPAETRCEALATKAGVGWQGNQSIQAEVLQVCDGVWSLAAALEKSKTLSPAGLAAGYNALGTFASPMTFQETWGPDRHAGNSMVEDIRYNTDCSCFRYTGVKTSY